MTEGPQSTSSQVPPADGNEEPSAAVEAGAPSPVGDAPTPAETVDPVAEAKAEAARYRDQLLRSAADLDNFRKRAKRDVVDAELRGRESMLANLLPVFDNLERASAHADTASEVQSIVDGLKMVMRQFGDTLSKSGIERVKSVGGAFDPAVHEAIQQLETDQYAPGCVALEIQGGYKLGSRLIRPALVAVAKAPVPKPDMPEPQPEPAVADTANEPATSPDGQAAVGGSEDATAASESDGARASSRPGSPEGA